MSAGGFRVRVAEAGDLAGVVALERAIAEAPHWAEAEYAAMVQWGWWGASDVCWLRRWRDGWWGLRWGR